MKSVDPKARSVVLSAAVLSLGVLLVWFFPALWFTHTNPTQGRFWLVERTNVAGWYYTNQPVSKTAEALLVADRLVSGEFRADNGTVIRVFSASRYFNKQNEIGLFSHTPDRCWTAVGWELEPVTPDVVDVPVHGISLRFERRVFTAGKQRELVYFGALVGGQPLPYRLDQFLASARRSESAALSDRTGTLGRLRRARLWGWIWESFVNRRPLAGPQQYLRISIPFAGIAPGPNDPTMTADALLTRFMSQWLSLGDYQQELTRLRRNGK